MRRRQRLRGPTPRGSCTSSRFTRLSSRCRTRSCAARGRRRSRALARYSELYDFAPVGYFTLGPARDHPPGEPHRSAVAGNGAGATRRPATWGLPRRRLGPGLQRGPGGGVRWRGASVVRGAACGTAGRRGRTDVAAAHPQRRGRRRGARRRGRRHRAQENGGPAAELAEDGGDRAARRRRRARLQQPADRHPRATRRSRCAARARASPRATTWCR